MYLTVCVHNEFLSCQKWQKMKFWTFQAQPQPPLEFFLQEQSYSSLHSGWSLAWDHIRGDIEDSCGAIADFCGVVADP